MKKPIEKKNPAVTESEPAAASGPSTRKKAAAKGVIASEEIGAGSGAGAMASGGEITPIGSTLIGNPDEGLPAASPKAEAGVEIAAESVAEAANAAPVTAAAEVAPPAQNVTIRKTGFWPTALGGVVAAGLGAAATIWALPQLPPEWQPKGAATPPAAASVDLEAIRAEATAAAETAARDSVAGLKDELAATAMPAADLTPMNDELATLKATVEAQAQKIAELTARPVIDPEAAGKVQELAAQAEALKQQIATAAEQAQSQISAAQSEAQKLQEAAADSTRRAEAVAAVAALQTALDKGVTPEEARKSLEAAGLDAPAALAKPVPSLESLQTGFGEAARAALRASLRDESAKGGGNLFTNFLRAQTGARSVAPREGNDPDAILSRANAEVEAGRIGAALDQMAALPETAKSAPEMAAWLVGANAYREAQAALSDLSATTN